MVARRIIPCLDMDNGFVVKGINFKNLSRCGDPVDMAIKYEKQGADELCFLDIGATFKSRKILSDVVKKVSEEVFIPMTVGGGIRTTDDIKNILRSGADKVSICTAALEKPVLIKKAAEIFGSQCIVISIDAAWNGNSWDVFKNGGRINSGINAIDWAVKVSEMGAGEILLNSIDRDGTKKGYDLNLCKKVSESVTIPLIISGGSGSFKDFYNGFESGEADAVLTASLLHYDQLNISDIKKYLKEKGVNIR